MDNLGLEKKEVLFLVFDDPVVIRPGETIPEISIEVGNQGLSIFSSARLVEVPT